MIRKSTSEFIGTYGLVFIGTGAITMDQASGGMVTNLGVGIAFGLAVAVMIYTVGHISGAHINPAVTLAFAMSRHFPWRHVPFYWFAQITGATAASLTLRWLFGTQANLGMTVPAGSIGQSFVLETVLSFFLMLVIMAVATDVRAEGQGAALAIGAAVGMMAIAAGPISGASMNPARSMGPAISMLDVEHLWIYWAAPVVGMLLAAVCYRMMRDNQSASGPRQTHRSETNP